MLQKSHLASLLLDNPEWVRVLKTALTLEERRRNEYQQRGYGEYIGWEWHEVNVYPVHPLLKMVNEQILDITLSTRSGKFFRIRDPQLVLEVIKEIEKFTIKHEPTEKLSVPDDLFSTIAGYEDIKALIRQALKAKRFHILFCGSPASAKTLILLELARLPGAFYLLGSSTTKAGLCQVLFEQQPKILLVDEIDKFQYKDIAVLLSLAETGIVRETKFGKQREIQLATNIFAAANRVESMPKELLSRFRTLFLPEYSEEEFIEAATKVLIDREKVSPELAAYIAEKTWAVSKDVREAVRIAKICKTQHEVDLDIQLLKRYTERSRLI